MSILVLGWLHFSTERTFLCLYLRYLGCNTLFFGTPGVRFQLPGDSPSPTTLDVNQSGTLSHLPRPRTDNMASTNANGFYHAPTKPGTLSQTEYTEVKARYWQMEEVCPRLSQYPRK